MVRDSGVPIRVDGRSIDRTAGRTTGPGRGRGGGRSVRIATAVLTALTLVLAMTPAASAAVVTRAGVLRAAPGAPPAAAISTTGLPAGSVRLTWSAASTSAPPVTGYVVGRTGSSTVNPTPYSMAVSAGQRSWIFSQLVPGQEYRFWVAAVDGSGTGPASTITYRYLPAGFVPAVAPAPAMPAVRWVSGTSAEISWLPPDSDGGSAVTGYEVARDGAAYGNPGPYSTTVSAATRARTFIQLIPGRTYTLSVRAITAAGKGPAATVRYTVPAAGSPQPDATVFALRETENQQTLERVSGSGPVGGGGPVSTTEPYRPVTFALDRQGSLYLADAVAKTVVRFPYDGSAPVPLGTGWGEPTDLNLDARGNVFVLDKSSNRVVMIRATDGRRIVFPQDAAESDLTVGPDGSVALSRGVLEENLLYVRITTVQAQGERPATVRQVPSPQFVRSVSGIDGSVHLKTTSGLGAGAEYLDSYLVGSTATARTVGPSVIAVGNDRTGRVLVSTIRTWCAGGGCPRDYAVDALTVIGAGAAVTSVPVSGIQDPYSWAGDATGRFYAHQGNGILRIPASEGAAAVVASGNFWQFAVG